MSDSRTAYRSGRFEAKPIAGSTFGYELDVDLNSNLSSEDREALRQVFVRDGLVLFHNQKFSMDQQIDACSIFGPVLRDSIENYLVSNVEKDGLLGDRELLFHVDVPYVPAPYLGGSLHALKVDGGVSATRFISAFRAWERLPEALKQRIDGLNTLQIKGKAIGRPTRMIDLEPGDNCAVHALVGRQEETGRPYIFANIDMTGCIIGMSEAESSDLLQQLYDHMYQPDEVFEHQWQVGDFIVWNNLAVQHARSRITGGTRTLQRVTIAKYGYWEQYPADLPLYQALQQNAA